MLLNSEKFKKNILQIKLKVIVYEVYNELANVLLK